MVISIYAVLCVPKKCDCGNSHATHPLCEWTDVPMEEELVTRDVTKEDKLILHRKCSTYKEQCVTESSIAILRDDSISLVVENTDKVFTVDDVMKHVSILQCQYWIS